MTKKDKKTTSNMTQTDFISVLTSMTPNEINQFISEKGKKPKLIKPFIIKGIP